MVFVKVGCTRALLVGVVEAVEGEKWRESRAVEYYRRGGDWVKSLFDVGVGDISADKGLLMGVCCEWLIVKSKLDACSFLLRQVVCDRLHWRSI